MSTLLSIFLDTPLWAILILTFVIFLVSFEGGVLLGKRHRHLAEREDRTPIGSIVGATLGLLAFLLAFTFGMSASRFDERRELVIEEANAIGTTYLRAEYLPEPFKSKSKKLLKEYVAVRLNTLSPGKLTEGLKKSGELQDQLWLQAVGLAEKSPESVVGALYIESLNEVIDVHAKRVSVGIRLRIPIIVWGTLYFVAILSLGSLGYQFGLTHTRYTGITLLIILTFSLVITLIADLDRPQEGYIKVSQQSLIDLMDKFNEEKDEGKSPILRD